MASSRRGDGPAGPIPIRRSALSVSAMSLITLLAGILLAHAPAARAAQDATHVPAIIPQPVSVTPGAGRFTLTAETVIWTDRATASLGRQLAGYLEPATGFALTVRTGGAPSGRHIVLRRDTSLARLCPEGYRLDVSAERVLVRASAPAGVFYALQTIRQLLPPDIFRETPVHGVTWMIPALTIEDYPRFRWRGGHLDVCRHFLPKEFVKKYIDLFALHKLNTFH